MAGANEATEGELRQSGRVFLVAMYAALRSLKLYPVENDQVQKSLDGLTRTADDLIQRESELEVRVAGRLLFINSTRLRLDLHNYASFSYVLATFRQAEVGIMTVASGIDRREWQVFVSLMLSFAARDSGPNKLSELREKMTLGGITHITVDPPAASEADLPMRSARRRWRNAPTSVALRSRTSLPRAREWGARQVSRRSSARYRGS